MIKLISELDHLRPIFLLNIIDRLQTIIISFHLFVVINISNFISAFPASTFVMFVFFAIRFLIFQWLYFKFKIIFFCFIIVWFVFMLIVLTFILPCRIFQFFFEYLEVLNQWISVSKFLSLFIYFEVLIYEAAQPNLYHLCWKYCSCISYWEIIFKL